MVIAELSPNMSATTEFTLTPDIDIGDVRDADIGLAFQANACTYISVDTTLKNVYNIPFIILTTLRSELYSLKQVIPLQVQSYQGHYLVSDIITYRHGLGATLDESIQDYEEDLIAYFDSLLRNQGNLSASLERELVQLSQYIEPQ